MAARLLGIDFRALGLFRVGLAIIVLGDLCSRSVDLDAFYTDAGVLPRSLLSIPEFRFSIHAMMGGRFGEEALFLLAGAFALLLLIGLWPRMAALASWVLLSSLDARDPLVLNHGDELLRILLFWSIFVPLSGRRTDSERGGGRHLSVFSAALTVQVCIVYVFGALLKSDPSWRITGTAIHSALRLEQFSTSLGRALLAHPRPLEAATLGVYYLELVGPLLLFVPWGNRRIREIVILSFVAMHLGIAATMKLGIFPWVSILGWVLVLPSETLDMFQRGPAREPSGGAPAAREGRGLGSLLRMVVQLLGAYLLSAVVIWNIRGLYIKTEEVRPTYFDGPLLVAQLDQRWNMFAPKPNYVCGWYVAPAGLADGSQVDLMNGGRPPSRGRPEDISAMFPDFQWRKYLMNLWRPQFERYRKALPQFLRWRWDRDHPETLAVRRLSVEFLWQNLSDQGDSPLFTTEIARD